MILSKPGKVERAGTYFYSAQGGEVISVGIHEDSFQLVSDHHNEDSAWCKVLITIHASWLSILISDSPCTDHACSAGLHIMNNQLKMAMYE